LERHGCIEWFYNVVRNKYFHQCTVLILCVFCLFVFLTIYSCTLLQQYLWKNQTQTISLETVMHPVYTLEMDAVSFDHKCGILIGCYVLCTALCLFKNTCSVYNVILRWGRIRWIFLIVTSAIQKSIFDLIFSVFDPENLYLLIDSIWCYFTHTEVHIRPI